MPKRSGPRVLCLHPGCGKSVRSQSDLPRHMLIHSPHKEEMMYRCPFQDCAYKSLQKSNVVTHIGTHTREKNKSCPDCDFASTDPASVTRHRKNIHGYQPKAAKVSGHDSSSVRTAPKRRANRHAPYQSHAANRTGAATREEFIGVPGGFLGGSNPFDFNGGFAGGFRDLNQCPESKPDTGFSNFDRQYAEYIQPPQIKLEDLNLDQTLGSAPPTDFHFWNSVEFGDELSKHRSSDLKPLAQERTPSLIGKPYPKFWDKENLDYKNESVNSFVAATALQTIEKEDVTFYAAEPYTIPQEDSPQIYWRSMLSSEHNGTAPFQDVDVSTSFCSSAPSGLSLDNVNQSSSSLQTSVAKDSSHLSPEFSFFNTPSPDGNLSGSDGLAYESSGSLGSQSFYDQWNIPQSYPDDANSGDQPDVLQYDFPDPHQHSTFSAGPDFGYI